MLKLISFILLFLLTIFQGKAQLKSTQVTTINLMVQKLNESVKCLENYYKITKDAERYPQRKIRIRKCLPILTPNEKRGIHQSLKSAQLKSISTRYFKIEADFQSLYQYIEDEEYHTDKFKKSEATIANLELEFQSFQNELKALQKEQLLKVKALLSTVLTKEVFTIYQREKELVNLWSLHLNNTVFSKSMPLQAMAHDVLELEVTNRAIQLRNTNSDTDYYFKKGLHAHLKSIKYRFDHNNYFFQQNDRHSNRFYLFYLDALNNWLLKTMHQLIPKEVLIKELTVFKVNKSPQLAELSPVKELNIEVNNQPVFSANEQVDYCNEIINWMNLLTYQSFKFPNTYAFYRDKFNTATQQNKKTAALHVIGKLYFLPHAQYLKLAHFSTGVENEYKRRFKQQINEIWHLKTQEQKLALQLQLATDFLNLSVWYSSSSMY